MNDPLFSPPELPANQPVKPDEEMERQTTAGSGRTLLQSSEPRNHAGASLKMLADYLLLSKAWYSKSCSLRWKIKVTRGNVSLYQLSPSMRRTDEIGSGLLATPNTMDSMAPKTEKAALREATVTRPARSKFSNLRDQIDKGMMLPTPRAQEPGATTKGYGKSLSETVEGREQMLPTPTSRDSRGTGNEGHPSRDSVDYLIEKGTRKGEIVGKPTGLKLRGIFVEFMMGYPLGWTDISQK